MTRPLERLSAGWALAGGLFLLAIMAVTFVNAGAFALDRATRAFDLRVSGLPGYEDFVRLGISCAAPMFLPWCQVRRGHVAVDIFVSGLPEALRRQLDRLWSLAVAALAVFLGYWMAIGMVETFEDGALSRVLGWPEWPFYLPGIASLALWSLVALAQAVRGSQDA